jgi:hypothetical protein
MKYTPNLDGGDFHNVDSRDPRFKASRIYKDESSSGFQEFAERFVKRLWSSPVEVDEDEPTLWTSLYMNRLAKSWVKSPFRFAIKLISLTVLPAFWTIIIWLIATFLIGITRPESCYFSTFVFMWMLRDSAVSLPARPSLRDFIKLFSHEAACKWMMFCIGIIVYFCSVHIDYLPFFDIRLHLDPHSAKKWGLGIAIYIYLYILLPRVSVREGAADIVRYLGQVLSIAAFTLALTIVGFFVTSMFGAPTWKCWSIAFLLGLIGLWGAVNQVYWPTGWKKVRRAEGEPIIQK